MKEIRTSRHIYVGVSKTGEKITLRCTCGEYFHNDYPGSLKCKNCNRVIQIAGSIFCKPDKDNTYVVKK